MKTNITAIIAAWLSFALNLASAQTPQGKISGQVFDAAKQPAIAATVVLVKLADSSIVKTTLADAQGRFVFDKITAGDYRLNISAVGFQKYRSPKISLNETAFAIEMPAISLSPGTSTLKEVSVTAQKPFIEIKADRTIVNVGTSITNAGANALEALEKAPGIIVNDDGTISYKGKTGLQIMIDNKPSYLSGETLANYLRSLPASVLDQIELMPNPPAQYDASGTAGIINIKTKRFKVKGFNGSAAASVGRAKYMRTSESLNINYRQNNINFFAMAGYSLQNGYRRLDVGRTYFDAANNIRSSYTEIAFFNPSMYNTNVKAGMDYYVSPKTTLGIVLSGVATTGDNHNPVNSFLRNKTGGLDSSIVANNNTNYNFKNGGINLNYSHRYDSLGKNITVDLDYIRYNNYRDQSFMSASYNAAGALGSKQDIVDNIPNIINIWSAKSDYTIPVDKKTKLAFGLKTSYVNTDNGANYFNINNNIQTIDYARTNRFLYKENINAAYINFNKDFKRISLQLGLRAENTQVNAHQLGNALGQDSSFVKNYTNLFPTGFILYKLDSAGKNSLNLSYGRRIERPSYQDLNPFTIILDKYSAFSGNPFLRPQFVNVYQFSYNYKGLMILQASYNYVSDYQVEYDYQQGDIFFANRINLGSRRETAFGAIFNLEPVKWWKFYMDLEYNFAHFKGQLGAVPINTPSNYAFMNTTSQFNLSHGWSSELNLFYVAPNHDSQFTHIARKQVNIGLAKKILDNNGTLRLGVRDLFKGNYSAGTINNVPGAAITYHNDNANRVVNLSFNYNFGKNANIPKKRQTGSAEAEQNRAGN